MRRLTIAAASILLACGSAAAGPLRGAWVDADAQWLLHLDCEGFRASAIGTFILEESDELGIDLGDFDELKEEIGLDPREDVFGVTIYGTSGDPGERQVIVAVTSAAADTALDRLQKQEGLATRKVQAGGYEITEIDSDGDVHSLHLRRLEGGDRRLAVLSGGRDQLVRALQVIDGTAPALSAGSKLLRAPREGSFVYAAAMKLDGVPEMEPASELLRLSHGFAADVGEREGDLSAEVTVSAATERDAADMAHVVEGMTAMGRLIAADEPDLGPIRDLAEALSVRVDEKRLTLRVHMKADELIRKLRECMADHDRNDGDHDDDDDHDHDDDDHDGGDGGHGHDE